jgi:hypothetical protein
MEKAFSLNPKEAQSYAQLEQESTRALAEYGGLTLQRKDAKKRLETIQEQQRSFVRSALMHRDVGEFSQARIGQGNLYCTLPDPVAEPPAGRANGRADHKDHKDLRSE